MFAHLVKEESYVSLSVFTYFFTVLKFILFDIIFAEFWSPREVEHYFDKLLFF